MAISTTNKKLSLMDGEVWECGLPIPSGDGSMTISDRLHLLHNYAGVIIDEIWTDVSVVSTEAWIDV